MTNIPDLTELAPRSIPTIMILYILMILEKVGIHCTWAIKITLISAIVVRNDYTWYCMFFYHQWGSSILHYIMLEKHAHQADLTRTMVQMTMMKKHAKCSSLVLVWMSITQKHTSTTNYREKMVILYFITNTWYYLTQHTLQDIMQTHKFLSLCLLLWRHPITPLPYQVSCNYTSLKNSRLLHLTPTRLLPLLLTHQYFLDKITTAN